MDAVLHRIEALPGDGRYAVTFRRPDGTEQTAVVQLSGEALDVAEASLPADWSRTSEAWLAVADAVQSVERSRAASAPAGGGLRDADGGWDVSLGNVALGENGEPSCIAHGEMNGVGTVWTCDACGAVARYG